VVSWFISKKRNYPKGVKVPRRLLLKEFFGAFWALMLTVLILYGIVGGFFSPTEAAMVACVYAVVIGMFVYKDLSFKELPAVILETAITTASIIVLVGLANLFAWILTSEQIPQMVADLLLSITSNKYLIILLINFLLLFVGTFMETIAALLTLFPTLLAVALRVGIDPIHFAMIAVLNLMIGLTTPPVGVCLFVASSIGKVSISRIARAGLPFLAVSIFVLLLVSYIPALSTWLPNLLFNR
ncbi:MAG TPA: TRAP transporter large permease, partial [Aminobacteriaceae bacterium]|nr:TRAP transporter large permease [Aminobacteriaceae bacterium]